MSVVRTFSPIDMKTGLPGPIGPTGPSGPNGPMNLFVTGNTNTVAPGETAVLTTNNSILQYLTVEAQLFVAGSINPGYLDIVGYTEPDTLTVRNTYNDTTVSWLTGDNVLVVGVQKNGGPNVIVRGGTSQILPLVSLNTSHYYTGSGSDIDIPTQMVENGIYEVYFNAIGADSRNNDFYLYPNSVTTYSPNTFYSVYQNGTGVTPALNNTYTNSNGFYIDIFGGSNGWNPMGKLTIFNGKQKKVRFEMGDTSATVIGTGYWTDGTGSTPESVTGITYDISTTWDTIGRIALPGRTFNNFNVWVKRIA